MSKASIAAARVYIAMQENERFHEAFVCSVEPYRAVMDEGRACSLHDIEDGSEDYAECVDCLEVLVCN
jgi:hypothetical protein